VSARLERPEVAVVRHPIADGRNNVVGYELRFGAYRAAPEWADEAGRVIAA
jgi:c-di-GMP-related signal transduction protein